MTEIDEEVLYICLAGTRVSNDLSLIQNVQIEASRHPGRKYPSTFAQPDYAGN